MVRILEQVKDVVSGSTVFAQPLEKDGLTVIPAMKVRGGGGGGQDHGDDTAAGGGGLGLDARPAGAFVVNGSEVSWIPAVDVNRIIFGAQLVVIIALISWRSVAKARARALRH
jgi:uncharacterized spore protein YtfJ